LGTRLQDAGRSPTHRQRVRRAAPSGYSRHAENVCAAPPDAGVRRGAAAPFARWSYRSGSEMGADNGT